MTQNGRAPCCTSFVSSLRVTIAIGCSARCKESSGHRRGNDNSAVATKAACGQFADNGAFLQQQLTCAHNATAELGTFVLQDNDLDSCDCLSGVLGSSIADVHPALLTFKR